MGDDLQFFVRLCFALVSTVEVAVALLYVLSRINLKKKKALHYTVNSQWITYTKVDPATIYIGS